VVISLKFKPSRANVPFMELFLVQHGQAMPESENPERPLSESGQEETTQVAAAIMAAGVQPALIRHSEKTRAAQTASIFAAALQPPDGVDATVGLGPGDDVKALASTLEEENCDVMLVGHLPHLARLTAFLITGDADRELVRFRNSGVVCLGRDDGPWTLRWAVTPECAPRD
jgi:phosphohistidine phosphatase